jgi:2'-5' RNA ligase
MDIKMKLRRALLEAKHKTHQNEYGCLMVYLDINKKKWDSILDLIDNEDLYQPEDDPTYGKENEPHVTILYGFHDDINEDKFEDEIKKVKKPVIGFEKVSAFENEKFDVLIFDVKSEDINKLNKTFKNFPHTNSYPDYHPHCTIAYLKPNIAKKYIKKFNNLDELEPKVSHMLYSKVDGTKNKYRFN